MLSREKLLETLKAHKREEQQLQAEMDAKDLEIQNLKEQLGLGPDEKLKDLKPEEQQLRAADVNQRACIDVKTFSRAPKERAQHEAAHEKKQREELPQMFGNVMLPGMGATGTLYSFATSQCFPGGTGTQHTSGSGSGY
ncbi:uncharacterized protein LOC135806872 isoform X2 [Sycon ciliatum]